MTTLLNHMSPTELRSIMVAIGCRTHQSLGDRIGVTRSCVWAWAKGKTGVPRHVAMLLRMLAG